VKPRAEGPINEPISIAITFKLKRNNRDLDNLCKCVLDGLQRNGIIKNDIIVRRLLLEKEIDNQLDTEKIVVSIYKWNN
jgi:Holliday junction resolvase RusA-like endonuclease